MVKRMSHFQEGTMLIIYILIKQEQIEDSCIVIESYVYHELLENV